MSEESTFWWGPWAKDKPQPPAMGVATTDVQEAAMREADRIRKKKKKSPLATILTSPTGIEEFAPVLKKTLGA